MNNTTVFIRPFLAFSQAVTDICLYWFSFALVIVLWLSDDVTSVFDFETATFFTGTMLTVFYFNSLYSFQNWLLWNEFKAILKSSVLILLVIVLYLYSQKFNISRFILTVGIFIFVPLCLITRYAFRRIFFALGLLSTNIIILGAGRTGKLFAEKITEHKFTACKVVGFLDDDESKQGKLIAGFPVLGRLDDLERMYKEKQIDEAAIAISTASRDLLTHILSMTEFHVRQLHYIPDMYMLTTFSSSIRDVEGLPLISASQGLMNPLNRAIKNIMDYSGAIIALIIFSPVMLWAALSLKRDKGGSVLMVQERIGRNLKPFRIYKFRTACKDSTKTERFLRRTKLYELPQLFNVLKGEMSLTGPEPSCLPKHTYAVKPGMTGLWQVSGLRASQADIRREMNLYYIRNWSVWLDTEILLKTLYAVLRGR